MNFNFKKYVGIPWCAMVKVSGWNSNYSPQLEGRSVLNLCYTWNVLMGFSWMFEITWRYCVAIAGKESSLRNVSGEVMLLFKDSVNFLGKAFTNFHFEITLLNFQVAFGTLTPVPWITSTMFFLWATRAGSMLLTNQDEMVL